MVQVGPPVPVKANVPVPALNVNPVPPAKFALPVTVRVLAFSEMVFV